MSELDVLVRGAGAVGLAGALALSRQGLRVALLAQETPRAADLRAYALNAASVRLLRLLKVWEAIPDDARTAVHEMQVQGDEAGAVLDFSAWSQGVGELAWIVDAAELERALWAAVRFAPHLQLVAQEVPAALQVLAEGRDSATRDRLGAVSYTHLDVYKRQTGPSPVPARTPATSGCCATRPGPPPPTAAPLPP